MSGKVAPELAGYTKSLYNTLFDLSKSYQNSLISPESKLASEIKKSLEGSEKLFPERAVVACQGTEGAYSQFACDRMFKYPEIMYVNSLDSVFEAVGRGLCRYGILPLENSTAGSVTAVYELMQKHKVYIVGSKMCIRDSYNTPNDKERQQVKMTQINLFYAYFYFYFITLRNKVCKLCCN